MTFVCKYVALYVPDLRTAERFYRQAFAMDLLFRESQDDEGTWHAVREELDWDELAAMGIDVGMVALRRDALLLALFRGTPQPGTLFELCVGMTRDEVEAVRGRLGGEARVLESAPGWLRFEDPFGFRWAVQPYDTSFRSSGEIAGRWIP